jgi:hypothetical protein
MDILNINQMEHTKYALYAYSRLVLIEYTEYGYNRFKFWSSTGLESVQPFARFNTFDRVCLKASVQPFTFHRVHEESIHWQILDRVRILKSTISPQRVLKQTNKVIARRQEVEWAIERQHEEQEVE